jgi:hypothetical protein
MNILYSPKLVIPPIEYKMRLEKENISQKFTQLNSKVLFFSTKLPKFLKDNYFL